MLWRVCLVSGCTIAQWATIAWTSLVDAVIGTRRAEVGALAPRFGVACLFVDQVMSECRVWKSELLLQA